MTMKKYSEEITQEANAVPMLGAEYFEARNISQEFFSYWSEEHVEEFSKVLINEFVDPLVNSIKDRVMNEFLDHFFLDAEYNAQNVIRDMVEKSVRALIGGDNWANKKYISVEGYRAEKVRETLAKLYKDEVKDGRIADLEKENKELKERLGYRNNYY